MSAQGNRRQCDLRERKTDAYQVLDHKMITEVPNLTMLKTKFPKCHFQFLCKEPFPTGMLCWHELLACGWLFASCWQHCSHMAHSCPHIRALPPEGCSAWFTHLSLPEPDLLCWIDFWPAPLDPMTFVVHLFWRRHWSGRDSSGSKW
jgi:hypothetical protein